MMAVRLRIHAKPRGASMVVGVMVILVTSVAVVISPQSLVIQIAALLPKLVIQQ